MSIYKLSREFNAPRELVYKAWTDAEHLKNWFGPKGMTIPVITMDFRVCGKFHYCLKTPDNQEIWAIWYFKEIKPPEKLVYIQSFSDKNENISNHPMSPTWPLKVLSTITFTEKNNKTLLELVWQPIEASDVEAQTFESSEESMNQGWAGTLDKLDEYLKII